jgi:hypothetical protein
VAWRSPWDAQLAFVCAVVSISGRQDHTGASGRRNSTHEVREYLRRLCSEDG